MRKPKPIVGLLPLGPRRAYLYWDLGPANGGGRYVNDLQPARRYIAEVHRNGVVVARSNTVSLPPEGPAPAPPVESTSK